MTETENISTEMKPNEEVHGFKYLLKLAFRLKYWILATVIVLVAVVFVSLRFVEKQYVRTCVVELSPQSYLSQMFDIDSLESLPEPPADGFKDEIEPTVVEMQSLPVLTELASQISGISIEDMRSQLSISYSKYSDVLRLSCQTTDTYMADSLLTKWVEVYNAYYRQQQLRKAQQSMDQINNAIAVLEQGDTALSGNELLELLAQYGRDGQTKILIQAELERKRADLCVKTANLQPALSVLEAPTGSDMPVSPHPKMLYLLAVVLGILCPLVGAELRDYFKRER